jgi:hypothetical protein
MAPGTSPSLLSYSLPEGMSFWSFFLPSLANTKSAADKKMMKNRRRAMRIIKRPMKAIMTRDISSPFHFLKPGSYICEV